MKTIKEMTDAELREITSNWSAACKELQSRKQQETLSKISKEEIETIKNQYLILSKGIDVIASFPITINYKFGIQVEGYDKLLELESYRPSKEKLTSFFNDKDLIIVDEYYNLLMKFVSTLKECYIKYNLTTHELFKLIGLE